jgi:hypothetical protein
LTGAKLASAQLAGANTFGMIDVQGNKVTVSGHTHGHPRQRKAVIKRPPQPWWKFWAGASK